MEEKNTQFLSNVRVYEAPIVTINALSAQDVITASTDVGSEYPDGWGE